MLRILTSSPFPPPPRTENKKVVKKRVEVFYMEVTNPAQFFYAQLLYCKACWKDMKKFEKWAFDTLYPKNSVPFEFQTRPSLTKFMALVVKATHPNLTNTETLLSWTEFVCFTWGVNRKGFFAAPWEEPNWETREINLGRVFKMNSCMEEIWP